MTATGPLVTVTSILLLTCAAAIAQESVGPDYQNRWHMGTSASSPTSTTVFNGHVGETPSDAHVPQSTHYSVLKSQFGLPVHGTLVSAPVVDTDDDGLPDDWEDAYGLSSGSSSGDNGADGDPDDDGLTNAQELAADTNPLNWDTDGDGLPDGWEVDYHLEPLIPGGNFGAGGDPDSDTWTNIQELYGESNPQSGTSLPTPNATLLDVTNGTALVAGASAITVQGVFLDDGCSVTVGGEDCANVSAVEADGIVMLSALAPPGAEGAADVTVVEPDSGTWDTWADGVMYTADPFDANLDTTPGVIHTWDDGTNATLYVYLPASGEVMITTPEDTELTIPAGLRTGYQMGFIIVRDAAQLAGLPLDHTPDTPDGFATGSPALDICGLVSDGATAFEIDEPFATPVTVTFPLTNATTDDALQLGSIDTHLETDLTPYCAVAPGETGELAAGDAPVSVDAGADTATFEVYDFTTYTALAPQIYPPSDVNQDGAINAVDVQLVINDALGIPVAFDCDVDGNGATNAIDVQLVINAALGIT